MDLVLVLSMTACAQQAIAPPVVPDLVARPAPKPPSLPVAPKPPSLPVAPAPQVAQVPEPAPVIAEAIVVEPAPPPPELELAHEPAAPAKATMPRFPRPIPKIKCNPQSRAGCRWREDADERMQLRVRQKQKAGDMAGDAE